MTKSTWWIAIFLALACIGLSAALQTNAQVPDGGSKLEKIVRIEFPKDGYAFTTAQAAKKVKIEYKIIIERDHEGTIPMPFPPSYAEPAGPSGMHPRERIFGNEQLYCLMDFGLAPGYKEVIKPIKKGVYTHSFEWDGRNWTGPSDFNNPKGKPFPAGNYEVSVTLHGKLMLEKGKEPYQIMAKTKLILKE